MTDDELKVMESRLILIDDKPDSASTRDNDDICELLAMATALIAEVRRLCAAHPAFTYTDESKLGLVICTHPDGRVGYGMKKLEG